MLIRGHKVMIDADLSELYGVSTKALNQAVKRNTSRFPEDFMFRLSPDEKQEVVTNCDHLNKLKFAKAPPFAFTEHGAIQAANVLSSPLAVDKTVILNDRPWTIGFGINCYIDQPDEFGPVAENVFAKWLK
jgi:hypothetical protein